MTARISAIVPSVPLGLILYVCYLIPILPTVFPETARRDGAGSQIRRILRMHLTADPARLADAGAAARKRAVDRFSLGPEASGIASMYESLWNGQRF